MPGLPGIIKLIHKIDIFRWVSYFYHGNWVNLILGNGLQLSVSSISIDNYWSFVWPYPMTLCLGKSLILAFPDWQSLKNLQKSINRQRRLICMFQPIIKSNVQVQYLKSIHLKITVTRSALCSKSWSFSNEIQTKSAIESYHNFELKKKKWTEFIIFSKKQMLCT